MIEKPPKIITENSAEKSKEIARREIDKSLGILSGEIPPIDTVNTEENEAPMPEPEIDTPTEVTEENKEEKGKSLPKKGETWHDKYDNY